MPFSGKKLDFKAVPLNLSLWRDTGSEGNNVDSLKALLIMLPQKFHLCLTYSTEIGVVVAVRRISSDNDLIQQAPDTVSKFPPAGQYRSQPLDCKEYWIPNPKCLERRTWGATCMHIYLEVAVPAFGHCHYVYDEDAGHCHTCRRRIWILSFTGVRLGGTDRRMWLRLNKIH